MVKTISLSFLISLLLLCCFSVPLAYSQTHAKFNAALERLDREIERVKELVNSFDNARAKRLVEQAQAARDAAIQAVKNRQFNRAEAKLKLAFSLLRQAERLALDGSLRRLRSRAEEAMRRADLEVLGRHNKEAERILREAKKNHEAAERAVAANNFIKAVEHYRVAIQLAERALGFVHRAVSVNKERIDEEIRRFQSLRDRAREAMEKSGDPRVKEIFKQAMKMAFSAEEALRNNNFELARNFYNRSILLLLRTLDLAGAEPPEARSRFQTKLLRVHDLLDRVRNEVESFGNPHAGRVLQRATRIVQEAELAAHQGHLHEALWKLDLARNLLRRARRVARGRKPREFKNKLLQEIDQTKDEIAGFKSRLDSDTPRDVQVLVDMAGFTINRAQQAFNAGMNRLALEGIWASQRFLTKADHLLRSGATKRLSGQMIEVRLNQLDEAIEEAERRSTENKEVSVLRLIEGAKDIRRLARKSFQNGNYRAADEGIQVAFELVRKSLRKMPGR